MIQREHETTTARIMEEGAFNYESTASVISYFSFSDGRFQQNTRTSHQSRRQIDVVYWTNVKCGQIRMIRGGAAVARLRFGATGRRTPGGASSIFHPVTQTSGLGRVSIEEVSARWTTQSHHHHHQPPLSGELFVGVFQFLALLINRMALLKFRRVFSCQ